MGKSKDLATGAAYQDQTESDARYVNVSGDTVTGPLTVDTATSTNLTVDSGVYGGIQFKVNGTNTGYVTSYTDGSGAEAMYIGGADTVNLHTGTNHALTGGTTRLQIDASGRVTTPSQPSFAARGLSSGSSGIDQVFPTVRYNVGSHYSNSTGRFTCPVAGTYLFGWSNIANTTNDVYRYYIRVNGSANISGTGSDTHLRIDTGATGSEYGTNGFFVFPVQLNANDYVNIYYYADGGTSTYTGADYPQFWGYLVG